LRLPPIPQPVESSGPRVAVQFVVELVGPRQLPGLKARELFSHPWFEALGRPMAYAMAPNDASWRILTPADSAVLYDSLALAWPYLDRRGHLTSRSAERLFHVAERLASGLERLAMPLTPPELVDERVRGLQELRETLDASVAVTVRPAQGWYDAERVFSLLRGLGFSEDRDRFTLLHPGWPEPLLEAQASADPQAGRGKVAAVDLGIRVARNPVPLWTLDALFETVDAVDRLQRSLAIDDEGNLVDGSRREWMKQQLEFLVGTLQQSGLPAGSPEARMVFFD